ncbi:hypothetical protein C0995_005885 [Termitomyces sp. Mi166|nr:hypothetical protein C0995_005885 [Termitomyces sp. Mi166\
MRTDLCCYLDEASTTFMKAIALENDPSLNTREPDFPVGLKESPIFQLQVTFAALQEGIQNCFNPVKLVESLQLRATEQQDAQEYAIGFCFRKTDNEIEQYRFSKLFISHLDAEFKKQANPRVKSLVTEQENKSMEHFATINHAKLEDRIGAILEHETLSGDNQCVQFDHTDLLPLIQNLKPRYLCPRCECLQDATRYTQLKELPPVLHFSLLRFVYDLSTMERKKSKHSVSFPTMLDMTPFMEYKDDTSSGTSASNMYKLRGVLLHKGSSAHHGHYEAQVFDKTNKSWFQFNDETVTKIKTLGKRTSRKAIIVDDDSDGNSQDQKTNVRKRRRIESKDESSPAIVANEKRYITSKDAYMLIYVRTILSAGSAAPEEGEANLNIPTPPSDALKVIDSLNAAHDEACEIYNKKRELLKARFYERRRRVMDVYRNWAANSTNTASIDSVLVSRQALSAWLSQHQGDTASMIASDELNEKKQRKVITMNDIMCDHGAVDPGKAENIKRLNYWRLTKPKMHVVSEGDPAPDSDDFAADVLCEHGGLSLNTTSRRRISTEAKLKNFHAQLLSEDSVAADNVSCAIIPIDFAKKWRKWLERPTDSPRPERVDNTRFLCEHDMLVIDPNVPSEFESMTLLILRSDWDILESLYSAGPLITIERKSQESGRPDVYTYTHNPVVCVDCRMRRRKEWTSTHLTIRLRGTSQGQELEGSKKGAVYSSSGARQSRRLRQIRELGEKRRFTVSKSTTIKEIKVMVQEELEIPTICQRLLHDGKELDDNTATMEALEIFAGDILDLRQENEVVDLDSDSEAERRPRDEGRGFHGTLLGSSESVDQATIPLPSDGDGEKVCSACTFSNRFSALSCTVCDTIFT